MTENKKLLAWVDEAVALCKPANVVWIDGSEEQLEQLRALGCSTGELYRLNEEKLPGCYLHRSAVNDVARVEGRTFICCRDEKDAGSGLGHRGGIEEAVSGEHLFPGVQKRL